MWRIKSLEKIIGSFTSKQFSLAAMRLYSSSPDEPNYASHLADPNYWKQRYKLALDSGSREITFEWLLNYETLSSYLQSFTACSVLDIGCGTSSLLLDLAKDHRLSSFVAVDIASEALEIQAIKWDELLPSFSQVSLIQGSAHQLPFRNSIFDLVLDKGTLDSVIKHYDSKIAEDYAITIIKEGMRVLKRSGIYLQITDEDPELRMPLLYAAIPKWQNGDFSISYKIINKCKQEYFLYLITKII